jgi:hypothetical protein
MALAEGGSSLYRGGRTNCKLGRTAQRQSASNKRAPCGSCAGRSSGWCGLQSHRNEAGRLHRKAERAQSAARSKHPKMHTGIRSSNRAARRQKHSYRRQIRQDRSATGQPQPQAHTGVARAVDEALAADSVDERGAHQAQALQSEETTQGSGTAEIHSCPESDRIGQGREASRAHEREKRRQHVSTTER